MQIRQSRHDYRDNFMPWVVFGPHRAAICVAKLAQILRNGADALHVFTSSGATEIFADNGIYRTLVSVLVSAAFTTEFFLASRPNPGSKKRLAKKSLIA
jgi:hypothetical protein